MKLHELAPPPGATRHSKRRGHGRRGGQGKTSGRGQKGQRSRSGHGIHVWSEGGQMPLVKRIPKRGFHHEGPAVEIVNIGRLERFSAGTVVDPAALAAAGLIRKAGDVVKILGHGTLTRSLVVKAHGFSQGAEQQIQKAGGQVERLPKG